MNRPYDREELFALLDAFCQGALSDEQSQRLVSILRPSRGGNGPLARSDYLEYMDLHAALQWEVGSRAEIGEITRHFREELRSEALLRVRSPVLGFLDNVGGLAMLAFLSHVGRRMRRKMGDVRFNIALVWIFTLLFAGAVAGVGDIIFSIFQGRARPLDQRIADLAPGDGRGVDLHAARLTRQVDCVWVDCVWSDETAAPKTGEELAAGRKLVLKSGLAEIVFQNGARSIVQGPATIEVRSATSAVLNRGKCTVAVETPQARGFEVRTPGMKYVDLGTEFGVLVAESGEQEVHVFRGKVQADEAWSRPASNSPLPAPRSMLLTAHEGIRLAAPGKPIERIAAQESDEFGKQFVREILDPFPLFGTGVGLDRGASDPHWEIAKISTDAPSYKDNKIGKPQRAVVVVPEPNYARDDRGRAQWISNSEPKHDLPVGCRWTLRTHFDLTGFDASTARIEGQVCADNYVVGIRVNGRAVPIPPGNRDEAMLARWLHLKIEEGFVAGDNTLEIVLENGDGTGPGNPVASASPMALCLELNGLARRSLKLKTEK